MGKDKKETAVKDHKNIDQLLVYASYVSSMFDAIFETPYAPEVLTHDKSVSMMLRDMALLYIKYDIHNRVICVVSLYDECQTTVVAELISCLKDIFKDNMHINEDTYVQDEVNKDLIWGREAIDMHHERVWGRKITHTVMFDDSLAGHS
jgi:hypothetical protein